MLLKEWWGYWTQNAPEAPREATCSVALSQCPSLSLPQAALSESSSMRIFSYEVATLGPQVCLELAFHVRNVRAWGHQAYLSISQATQLRYGLVKSERG